MEIKLGFYPEQLTEALTVLAAGMISIFLVIGVIIVATVALNKVFSGKEEKKDN